MYQVRYVNTLDPRLGRHVNHDPQSRRFPIRVPVQTIESTRHVRHVPVFDQANLGSCLPNAGVGCLATGLFYGAYTARTSRPYTLDEPGALQAYRDVTRMDPFPGSWEPDDTGSDGLSMAKLLVSLGVIPGYEHGFTIDQGLAGLMQRPQITGINWMNDMYAPDAEGIVHPTGKLRGGHEIVWDEYDKARGLCGFTNSWGAGWGAAGRFFIPAEEYAWLLERDGDVTSFLPPAAPAPEPAPVLDEPTAADLALYKASHKWAGSNALCGRKQRSAHREWESTKAWPL
jgi:hypothetical protein